jgi:hypothetical protein
MSCSRICGGRDRRRGCAAPGYRDGRSCARVAVDPGRCTHLRNDVQQRRDCIEIISVSAIVTGPFCCGGQARHGVVHTLWRAARETALQPSRFLCTRKFMVKAISVHTKKRRGRPATGHDPAVTTRLRPDVLARVAQWAADNGCHRSQAIARLVERGLESEDGAAKPRRTTKPK